jgi:preprotein translocase subunit SecF
VLWLQGAIKAAQRQSPKVSRLQQQHQQEFMFSNDQNIETIGQLVDTLKHYVGLQKEYVKLGAIEKTVRILTSIAMVAILGLLLVFILIFLSFAAAFALGPIVGQVAAFVIIAAVYVIVLLFFLIFRKQWIEKPLVRFLANLLLS